MKPHKRRHESRTHAAPPRRALLYALFFLSGATGLVYEVVWVRQLTLILGASTYAVTIILAAFMTGLGLGAWFIGRLADRLSRQHLAWSYVALEAGIGLYALALPALLRVEESVYVALYQAIEPGVYLSYLCRLVLAFVTFAVPTSLMGATLPILARYLARSGGHVPTTVSRLYALNTLGATLGTVAAGYMLIPALGNTVTTLAAAAGNLAVAAAFLRLHCTTSTAPEPPTKAVAFPGVGPEPWDRVQIAAAAAFTLSGAAAMTYEVAWTRSLSMVVGTTTFAFTTMLATFLLGIGLGSALYGPLRRSAPPLTLLVTLQFVIAGTAALSLPLFARLPFLYLSLVHMLGQDWSQIQVLRFVLASLVMLVPTLALGAVFPTVSEIIVTKTETMGARLGRASGLNTFGAVLGAAAAGLLLIPRIGLENTVIAGAAMNLIAGCAVMLVRPGLTRLRRFAPIALAGALLFGVIWAPTDWSPGVLNSGVYVYASRYHDLVQRVESAGESGDALREASPWALWRLAMDQYEPLYFKTGPAATVSVMQRNDGVRFLTVDGKTDASTSLDHDMKTQTLLGQLPLLFHPAPDKVFVVGLGSGVTAGAVLTHDVRMVDCAEFSPAVIEAARYFAHTNHQALDDGRLRIVPRDARNCLLVSKQSYDVIISQPSNPWISGQSSLFTREWYALVRERLAHGGIFAQWMPTYCMSEDDVRIIIHTLRSVFPHVTLWSSGAAGDLIFLAPKDGPLRIDYGLFRARAETPAIQADIARLGVQPPLLPFVTFAMSESDLAQRLYAGVSMAIPYNTDDRLITEFSTPRNLVKQHVSTLLASSGDMRSLAPLMDNIHPEDFAAEPAAQEDAQS